MKKLTVIPIVLLLLLLAPALVTHAQKVAVTGLVYEKGMVKVPFNTSLGTVICNLPDDMTTNEKIRGTVLYEPSGKNEKQQKKNLEQLMRYRLFLPDSMPNGPVQLIDMDNSGGFTCNTGKAVNSRNAIILGLKDPGNTVIQEAELAIINTRESKMIPTDAALQTDKKVYLAGETLVEFGPEANFYFSYLGAETSLKQVAGSPRKTVLQLPLDISGPAAIISRNAVGAILAKQEIHMINLSVSCTKLNLLKEETTDLNITITGLKGYTGEYLRLNLDNETVNAVKLGASNHEEIVVETGTTKNGRYSTGNQPQSNNKEKTGTNDLLNTNQNEENQYSLQRTVTALQSGNFVININLSWPASVYNDPFRQQIDAIKTFDQLNEWQSAFQTDLKNFSQSVNISTGITYSGPAAPDPGKWFIFDLRRFPDWNPREYIYDSLLRIIKKVIEDNKKDAEKHKRPVSPDNLEGAKALSYSFAMSFHFPKEVVEKYFNCTLVAGNIGMQNALMNAGTTPVNYEVIQTALKYAELRGILSTNNSLKVSTGNFSIIELWERLKKYFEEKNKKIKESDPSPLPPKKFNDPKPIGGAGTQIEDDIPIDMDGVTEGELQVKRIAGRLYTTLRYLMWRIQEDITNNGGKEAAKLNSQLKLIINEIMSDRR